MLLARSLLYDACFYTLMAVMGLACLPAAAVSRGAASWSIRTYCRIALWLLRVICGLRVEVRGRVPRGGVIVASKHQSFLDILIHVSVLPRPRFIMKRELLWAPVLGLYATRIGSIPVRRGARGRAIADMVRAEDAHRTRPGQLVIYPQGTRTAPGAKLPYKVGAGVLYQRLDRTCVPAATNAGAFWGRNSLRRRPGLAVVEYLDPIAPGLPVEAFMAQLEGAVEPASDRLLAEAGASPAA